jgi:prepilin-type N-terminal cleavage/methylation domain-containing protein
MRAPVRRNSGFTILEIIVVLLLMTILAATVLGRSVLPAKDKLDLGSATEKLRLQVRYAQAQAMKRSDTVWGIKSIDNRYWLFTGLDPNDTAKQQRIPGGDYVGTANTVNAGNMGVVVSDFTVFFDRIGKPYRAYVSYTNPAANTEWGQGNTPTSFTVTGAGETRTIDISPETGMVQ